ncbi:MAG: hypothetical protein ACRBFS_25725 [Aureispira sp.]
MNIYLIAIGFLFLLNAPEISTLQPINEVNHETISITGCITKIPSYNKKMSHCGELAYAGVFEFLITESIQKDMIGKKVLIVLKCKSIDKKRQKYHILAKKKDKDSNMYLLFNEFEDSNLPLYWTQEIKKVKRKSGVPPRE